MNTQELKVK